jgi:hypothetical protein
MRDKEQREKFSRSRGGRSSFKRWVEVEGWSDCAAWKAGAGQPARGTLSVPTSPNRPEVVFFSSLHKKKKRIFLPGRGILGLPQFMDK